MSDVVREGLVPNLETANKTVQPGSPQWAQLAEVKKNAASDLDDAGSAVPANGKLADNEKVKKALEALTALKSAVK
jgi:hypothetical protein